MKPYQTPSKLISNPRAVPREMSKEVEMAGGGEAAGIEPLPECSLKNVTVIMTRGMENAFFRWGYRIAKYPWYVCTDSYG